MSKRRVAYYYDRMSYVFLSFVQLRTIKRLADVGAYSYGVHHAMKPQRMRITHELVQAYDMLPKMTVLVRLSILLPVSVE